MAQALKQVDTPADRGARLRTTPIKPLPERLAVGRGTALFMDGCCSHPDEPITELRVVVDDDEHPVLAKGQPPPGRLEGSDYWWAIVPVAAVSQARLARVRLRARLRDGREATAEIGAIELSQGVDAPPPVEPDASVGQGSTADGEPLIAVCMATYDPPLELFERQIESIRTQTHRNWICVISDDCSAEEKLEEMRTVIGDDDRFSIFPSRRRLGFYSNFERALALAPEQAAYVALCDQDDRWEPSKLEALLSSLGSGAKLAYSDMRIVEEGGTVISDTYWTYRRNNHTNFGSLLVANTITGAASLFTRDVLDYALPLPPRLGNAYHDHWIALVAMSLGRVAYVDRPLYDYVQHGGAAIGHARANAAHRRSGDRSARWRRRIQRLRRLRLERFHPGWRYLYFDLWCQIALTARVAELRCGDVMSEGKRKTLRRFDDSRTGIAWLAARSIRPILGATETLKRERVLLAALAWRRLVEWRTRFQAVRRMRAGSGLEPSRLGQRPVRAASEGVNGRPAERRSEWLEPLLVDYFTRDGSTLMMRLLGSSPEIAVEQAYPFERKYFAYLWRWARVLERGDWPEDSWGPSAFGSLTQERQTALIGPPPWRPRDLMEPGPDDGAMADRCFELAWSEFSRRAARWTRAHHRDEGAEVRYYAEKHLNTWQLDLDELPSARVIALVRDPRDTFVSINAFNRLRGETGFGRDRIASDREHVERVIARQRERLRWIARLLDEGEVPVVRYDDLVLDLPAVARRLEAWLEVRLDPDAVLADKQVRRVHVSAKSPAESIGRWRSELDPEVAEAFTRELEPELKAVGLEA